MTITTQFDVAERVYITGLDCMGYVLAIWIGESSSRIQYQIRYLFNGDSKVAYFFEKEIAGAPQLSVR